MADHLSMGMALVAARLAKAEAERDRWKEVAEHWLAQGQATAELREALADLVACKDMKERLEDDDARPVSQQMPRSNYAAIRDAYERMKPAAWKRARKLLKGGNRTDGVKGDGNG